MIWSIEESVKTLAFIAREVLRMFCLVCGSNLIFTLLDT
jgi:hypothetical protein